MINVKLNGSSLNLSEKTLSPIVVESQLDTSLDSGTVKYLATESDGSPLNDALASYSIGVGGKNFDFVGMDSRALVRHRALDKKTVTQQVNVMSIEMGLFYTHYASGAFKVGDSFVEVLRVSGSVGEPQVSYNNGSLGWGIYWVSQSIVSKPYTIEIEYSYLSDQKGVYLHEVSLTEPSKLLQGVMIDGFGVTQPEDETKRKTLYYVVNRLLAVTPFDGQRFTLTNKASVIGVLKSVKSPEFKWNTQTTLWECLLQIGAVIDAVPRLVMDNRGKYTVVTFDFVNAFGNKADNISDQWTNAEGQNINEGLYNTALSAVVENLRESD